MSVLKNLVKGVRSSRARGAVSSTGSTMAVVVASALLALLAAAPAAHAAPQFAIDATHSPTVVNRGDAYMTYTLTVRNTGDTATTAATNVNVALPAGMSIGSGSGTGWSCYLTAQTCSTSATVAAGASLPNLTVAVDVLDPAALPDVATATFTAFGGGASSGGIGQHSFIVGPQLEFGLVPGTFTATANDDTGADYTQAGGHPFSANASFHFNTMRVRPFGSVVFDTRPYENVRDTVVNLPPGFVANPSVVAGGCTIEQVSSSSCPERFAVGRAFADLGPTTANIDQEAPIYKVLAEAGYPAAFAFRVVSLSPVTIILRPKVRPGDFGVTAFSPLPPQAPELYKVDYFTFCAFGARVIAGNDGNPRSPACNEQTDAAALPVPFLTNQTECASEPPVTTIDVASYQNPGAKDADGFPDLSDPNWKSDSAVAPAVTGCDQVPFDPSVTVAPTAAGRDSASGLDFDLDVPQDGLVDPDGIATSHLKKTVVTLPEGLTVNPSAAAGLQGCDDAQVGFGELREPQCPEESKIGSVSVTSPLIDEVLTGDMHLATPKSIDPASGEMLRLFLIVRNDKIGVMVKLRGSTVADPQTGQLTATFDNNPRLPFDRLEVDLKGGARGVLATPPDCGTATTQTALDPWSGTGEVDRPSDFEVGGDCVERFAPTLAAGNSDNTGRGQGGTYSFKFSRQDGDQQLRGLTATLPKGLLASVKDVPLCSNVAADAGSCPAGSKIGVVDAKAGAGDPFVLEQKGEMFLTEGYKGGEYGLAVKIRPVAGPFRGAMELSPIIVRQAIHVDRTTAQVTAVSDPFPLIHHGVVLRAREVNVLVNRDGFMLNPSDCSAKQSGARLLSDEGATADLSSPFQVSGCAALAFKPKLALRLTGRRQVRTGKHPGIRAQVTQQGTSEAGIEKAVVRLPKSLALDVNNAQALCEFVDGTKPDLENHCPKGSIVGRARAKTPLLKNDLVGNVYFVKNIRIDKDTGNEIRTLPMIIVALRGEISVNLRGESDTTKAGKLVNTFNNVPDAPISQFNLNIKGGSNGILAVTRTRRALINLCAKPRGHVAEADMDGHNGRRHDRNIRMATPCSKRQTKNAKRAAKKAARKARNARRG